MTKIDLKLETIEQALKTLGKSIPLFEKYEKLYQEKSTEENEELFWAMRDSMVQRFEYCVDLFWKVLKVYLEDVEKVTLEKISPRSIIRAVVKVGTISQQEGQKCVVMIDNRNQTSHMYHEEVAQEIASKVPGFYELLYSIVKRVAKQK